MNSSTRSAGRTLGTAIRALLVFTLLLGVGYTALITGAGQLLLPAQANGSLVRTEQGDIAGSSLIGQSFTDANGDPLPEYFQSRPSAADNDGTASGGSNLGPESPDLVTAIAQRRAEVATFNGVAEDAVPADALTASGSGLDPDISPAYAAIQIARVAAARGMTVDEVTSLVAAHTNGRELGFLGEPTVNVLTLNLSLDERED